MKRKLVWAFVIFMVVGIAWAGYDKHYQAPRRAKRCVENVKKGDIIAVNPADNPYNTKMYEFQKVEAVNGDTIEIRRSREITSDSSMDRRFAEPDFFRDDTEEISRQQLNSQELLDGYCE